MSEEERGFYAWLRLEHPEVELNDFQHHAVNFVYGEGGGIYQGGGAGAGKTFLVNLLKEYEESLKDAEGV